MPRDLYDAIIVGGGAAGLSAALLLGRACRSVLLCDDGQPRNAVAERMHGFLTRDGTPPGEMLEIARAQLAQYPAVEYAQTHINQAERDADGFFMRSREGLAFRARSVLLATGLYDALPEIEGIRERWGRGVFVCPYCDGWELRDKRLAVIGKGARAVELAQELYQWSPYLLVCLQEDDALSEEHRRWLRAAKVGVHRERVAEFGGEGRSVECVIFSDGRRELCDAAFICAPLRQRYPLVEMLGCEIRSDGEIDTDARGRTNVPGVYAAGDAVTTIHQVALAAASGARAAMAINEDLLAGEVRALISRNEPG
jgi:thioredoxin reductase